MAQYFFDLLANGSHQKNDIGVELATLEEVRHEAMKALPAIATDEVPKDGDHQNFTMLVRDEEGRSVYTATLTFAGSWLSPDKQEG